MLEYLTHTARHENANSRKNRYKMSKLVKSIRPISFRANLLSSRLKSTSQHLIQPKKKKLAAVSFFYSNGRLVILLPSQFLQFQILTKVTIRFYPGHGFGPGSSFLSTPTATMKASYCKSNGDLAARARTI